MDEFDPRSYANSKEEASAFIACHVEVMQSLYSEAVLMAKEFDIRMDFKLELPENAEGGHNRPAEVWWNPSSQRC